jgi:hypothetical protein
MCSQLLNLVKIFGQLGKNLWPSIKVFRPVLQNRSRKNRIFRDRNRNLIKELGGTGTVINWNHGSFHWQCTGIRLCFWFLSFNFFFFIHILKKILQIFSLYSNKAYYVKRHDFFQNFVKHCAYGNLSKVGTGNVKNSNSSTTLILDPEEKQLCDSILSIWYRFWNKINVFVENYGYNLNTGSHPNHRGGWQPYNLRGGGQGDGGRGRGRAPTTNSLSVYFLAVVPYFLISLCLFLSMWSCKTQALM